MAGGGARTHHAAARQPTQAFQRVIDERQPAEVRLRAPSASRGSAVRHCISTVWRAGTAVAEKARRGRGRWRAASVGAGAPAHHEVERGLRLASFGQPLGRRGAIRAGGRRFRLDRRRVHQVVAQLAHPGLPKLSPWLSGACTRQRSGHWCACEQFANCSMPRCRASSTPIIRVVTLELPELQ